MSYVKNIVAVITAWTCFSIAHAQSSRPAFEVASVKQAVFPNDAYFEGYSAAGPCNGSTNPPISGNRITLKIVSLCGLIAMAYDVRGDLIVAPDWVKKADRSLYYEIAATVPEGTSLTSDGARQIFQTLLADRFQLKVHPENRELDIYALVACNI
jgi:uncharacterized protein (TIGR03435 family)